MRRDRPLNASPAGIDAERVRPIGLRSVLEAMSTTQRLFFAAIPVAISAGALVAVLALISDLPPRGGGAAAWSAAPSPGTSPGPDATPGVRPSPSSGGADPILGTDGRLTVLLLGSDARPREADIRTDPMMVVSVEPISGEAAAVSLLPDMVDFPLVKGGRFLPRLDSLYAYLQQRSGDGGREMRRAVGRAIGVEVDAYVLLVPEGARRLVDAVGGIDVVLEEPYYDPDYRVDAQVRGWRLPAGRNHLDAIDAGIFIRSRKGDDDVDRARRQQQLVMAALAKVSRRNSRTVPILGSTIAWLGRTDLPIDQADTLVDIITTIDTARIRQAVLGPPRFASTKDGAHVLRVAAARRWVAANFPEPMKLGTWPPHPGGADEG